MPGFVLDASVLLKTVLPEDQVAKDFALQLFKKYSDGTIDLIEPVFWIFEVGNNLSRKLPVKKAVLAFNFLLNQHFQLLHFTNLQLIQITRFASRNKVAFYDASYHLLAKFTGSIFVTADKKYFQKFTGDKNIALLEELKFDYS